MPLKYNCIICNQKLSYEGLCWKCKAIKAREDGLNLTDKDIEERQSYLVEHVQELGEQKETAYNYFWECLAYHGVISEDLQRAAVEQGIYYPCEIYYHAPKEIRDILIERLLEAEDAWEASRLQTCLAMQGDERALEVFYELKKAPKEWRKELYVDPDVYAYAGGWSFDEAGKRLPINYSKCYSMEKKNTGDRSVMIGKTRKDKCPHCNTRLVDLLSIDGNDERLKFLGVDGRITAVCCVNCVLYAGLAAFSRFRPDGEAEGVFPYDGAEEMIQWLKKQNCDWTSDVSETDLEELSENGLELSGEERPLFYGASDWDVVTLGGFANWINDCTITKCPDCGKPMRYLAQLPWETIMSNAPEGTLYVEMCPDCKVISMHHQQT